MTSPPAPDGPFDRRLRRLRRDRAAAAQHRGFAAYLRAHMAEELLARLDLVTRPFREVLDLGSADGTLAYSLRARGLAVTAADAGFTFARINGGVQCDEDRLPFADASFDLVVSAAGLDTVNDLPGALTLIRRVLRPDGLFLGAFVGAGSLAGLKSAMRAADEATRAPASPHVHPQIDVRAAGDLLSRAGFAMPVVDCERLTVRFGSFAALISDLRAMAATNLLAARSRRSLPRTGLAAAIAAFEAGADADGKIPERFELVHLSGWAPAADQPKPARRGSGRMSLSEALRPREP